MLMLLNYNFKTSMQKYVLKLIKKGAFCFPSKLPIKVLATSLFVQMLQKCL